jgi:hypothetical protein
MATTPSAAETAKNTRLAKHQMGVFGLVLMMWSNTELLIEMVIQRKLQLSLESTCIICGPLGGGAKISLLFSLLKDDPQQAAFCDAVRAFQNLVGRNALAHGFPTYDKEGDEWDIVSREVKNGLSVRRKPLSRYLDEGFMPAFELCISTSGFTDQQMHNYGQAIAALAPLPAVPAPHSL